MTTPLPVNMLIAWSPLKEASVEIRVDRILWCDPAQIHLVTIDVFAKDALPLLRPYEEVARALERGDLRVPETDPFAVLRRAEADIAEKHRQRRDAAWELIRELVEPDDVDFLINPTVRGRRIAIVMAANRRTKRTIYKYLRRFWQGGQIKNALLPAFEKCGGRGKRRLVEAGREHDAPKLGRRSALAKVSTGRTGVRLSADIERKFERGIRKFYENRSKRSLTKAFKKTLSAFFYVDVQLKSAPPLLEEQLFLMTRDSRSLFLPTRFDVIITPCSLSPKQYASSKIRRRGSAQSRSRCVRRAVAFSPKTLSPTRTCRRLTAR